MDGSKNQESRKKTPRKSNHVRMNRHLIEAAEAPGLQRLSDTIDIYLPQMNVVNLCTALHRLAKVFADSQKQCAFSNEDRRELSRLVDLVLVKLAKHFDANEDCPDYHVSPQDLSNIMWALATLRAPDQYIIQYVTHFTLNSLLDFKLFELATLIWAAAKLAVNECMKPLFSSVSQHVRQVLLSHRSSQIPFRTLSTLAWAYAKANEPHPLLFETIALHMTKSVKNASSKELANTIWAFAIVRCPNLDLMRSVKICALQRIHEFEGQDISNMLWGCGALEMWDAQLFKKAVEMACCTRLESHHFGTILWACCKLHPQHRITQNAIVQLLPRCARALPHFTTQEVVYMCSAVFKALAMQRAEGSKETRLVMRAFFKHLTSWLLLNMPSLPDVFIEKTYTACQRMDVVGMDAWRTVEIELVRRSGKLSSGTSRRHSDASNDHRRLQFPSVDAELRQREPLEEPAGGRGAPRFAWNLKNTFLEAVMLEEGETNAAGSIHHEPQRRSQSAPPLRFLLTDTAREVMNLESMILPSNGEMEFLNDNLASGGVADNASLDDEELTQLCPIERA